MSFIFELYPSLGDSARSYDLSLTVNAYLEISLDYVDLDPGDRDISPLPQMREAVPNVEEEANLALVFYNNDTLGAFLKPLSFSDLLFRHQITQESAFFYISLSSALQDLFDLPSQKHAELRKQLITMPEVF
jgi:hypothetical protein